MSITVSPDADVPRTAELIDADLHIPSPQPADLLPYISAHWREQFTQTGFKGATFGVYPESVPTSVRPDLRPHQESGSLGLDGIRAHVLADRSVKYGIANCSYAADSISNPDAAAAVAAAVNEWQCDEVLRKEQRLKGTIVVPSYLPDLAAAEIRRVGERPEFVQVCLPVRSAAPYGRRGYHDVFAAAVEHDLVVSLQYGGFPGPPTTGAGWPSHFIEDHVGMASVAQSQVISLVTEGVFNLFPTLRVSVAECGFTWLPSLMWRFDKDWKGLRREVPWLRRPPSEYIADHMRFTMQPLDLSPNHPWSLMELVEQANMDNLLMFSTDYPHWHSGSPSAVIPDTGLSNASRAQILSGNARQHYRLP